MFRQWLALVIIVLVYIPVAIDATVLHVAAPTLSMTLGASGNELLWIIDIYSLVMAGMVLPMGALGDRMGFKRLLMIGSMLFGVSSLAAAFAPSAGWLIAARASLAIGAAMIIPATLAGIRTLFTDARDRNIALGVWAAVGSGGAAFGPLIGGILLEHFYWGSVFLINVPIVLVVVLLAARFVPRQQGRPEQPLNISHAIMLIVAILLLVYSAKTALKGVLSPWLVACTLLSGAVMLLIFVRIQLRARVPMIDMRLFCHRIILSGVVMAMTAMIALVGFELLMAQELQFVHGFTPFEAGMFMLPVMVASGFSGPIAGVLVRRLGLRIVAAGGMGLSAVSFIGLSMLDFSTQQWQAWSLMVLLGFSAASALLAAACTEQGIEHITPVCADLRSFREGAGSYDLCACNPPYFTAGEQAADRARATARHETDCTLDDVCKCAFRLLKDGGRLSLCHRPERLAEVLAVLRAHRLEPKRLAFVKNRPDAAPWLFLVEAQKNRKTGLRVEPDVLISAGAAMYGR